MAKASASTRSGASPRSAWTIIGGAMAVGLATVLIFAWATPPDMFSSPLYWLGVGVFGLLALLWVPPLPTTRGQRPGRKPVLSTEVVAILILAFSAIGLMFKPAHDALLPIAYGGVGFPGGMLGYMVIFFVLWQKFRYCSTCSMYRWFVRRDKHYRCEVCDRVLR